MRPLRVCVDGRTAHGVAGGIQQFIIGLVSGLSRLPRGHEEYVVLGNEDTPSWLAPHVGGACRILQLASAAPRTDAVGLKEAILRLSPSFAERLGDLPVAWRAALPALPASSGALEALEPDVVHFTTQDAFLTKVPSIYHPHDLQHLHLPRLFTRRARFLRDRSYRAFCEQAAMIAVVSSWTQKDVVAHYGLSPDRVQVVPFAPVTQAYAAPSDAEVAVFLEARRLPRRFVFYPAQTWPHKNHAALLDALARLKTVRGLVVPLVSTGHRNAHHEVLERRARSLGISDQVRFLGFVTPTELQCAYRACTAIVIPSLFEAASFPLWEAFLAGAPAACSNVTSLPAQAGDAALVFDPRDVAQIADAVARLWTDPALGDELARRGKANVFRFSWDRTARMFRAHYRRIAGRPLDSDDRALLESEPLL